MVAFLSLSWSGGSLIGRRLGGAGHAVARGLSRLGRAVRNRREASALARLDDHMLADIGLTRSDLRDAYSQPLWHDPTDVLAGRAAERRTRRPSAVAHSENDPRPSWLRCETANGR